MTTPLRLASATLYPHERDSVLVPLPFIELPTPLRLLDLTWHRKTEFHVTAVNTPAIAERIAGPLGLDADAALDLAWEVIRAATAGASAGDVVLRDELWIVRAEGDRTLIALCDVDGLGELYERLGRIVGIELAPPPAHVTLYTAEPAGGGIGVHTREQLERDGARLPPDAAAELTDALRAALP